MLTLFDGYLLHLSHEFARISFQLPLAPAYKRGKVGRGNLGPSPPKPRTSGKNL